MDTPSMLTEGAGMDMESPTSDGADRKGARRALYGNPYVLMPLLRFLFC